MNKSFKYAIHYRVITIYLFILDLGHSVGLNVHDCGKLYICLTKLVIIVVISFHLFFLGGYDDMNGLD